MRCRIIRQKASVASIVAAPFSKMYPTYELYYESEHDGKIFLLCARKRKKSKATNYLISTSQLILKDSHKFATAGKLRANFVGTEFNIFDAGYNAYKRYNRPTASSANGNDSSDDEDQVQDSINPRQELGAVIYDANVLGLKGPRKMTVLLPAMRDG